MPFPHFPIFIIGWRLGGIISNHFCKVSFFIPVFLITPLSTNFSLKCYLLFEKVSIFCKFFLASHACIQTAKCTSSASSQSYSTIDIFGEQALSILEKHKESQWCFCCHCSHFRLLRYLLSLSERPPFARYFLCKAQERVILLCTCEVSS